MISGQLMKSLSPEQEKLWSQVQLLWYQSQIKAIHELGSGIHPQFSAWTPDQSSPYGKEYALQLIGDVTEINEYQLSPHRVEIIGGNMGVVHYAYRATISSMESGEVEAEGRITDFFIKQEGSWVLAGRHGSTTDHREILDDWDDAS